MNTCLSGLWDVILEKYYSVVQNECDIIKENECKIEISKIIAQFYASDKVHMPLHIEVFQHELRKEESNMQEAAKVAGTKAGLCGLCVSCKGCAGEFYKVLQGKKEERPLPLELKNYFSGKSQLYYYLSSYKSVKSYRRINNTLICLKGFSSTTPAIYSATFESACTGGGFYLNVGGYGIAIDPGIGFVDSMHKQGIFIEDINAVIVTHNHLDHNADVGTISALLHDINRYYNSQVKFYKNFFHGIKSKVHEIDWWLDESTQENNKEIIEKSNLLSQCREWTQLNEKVYISALETRHMLEGKSYGIKYKVEIDEKDLIVGYTSDTRFFPEIMEFMKECDILIFHISDIYEKDVRGTKQKNSHLGYDGSLHLLKGGDQQFRIAIASEFCCNNGDYRMKVVRKLNEYVKEKGITRVIPGEVGLKIDLQSSGIYCSHCKRVVPVNSVSVVSSEEEFGTIQYVCENCQYSWINNS